MQLIRLKISRISGEGVTHYHYPTPHYIAEKILYGPIYEGSLCAKDAQTRNANDEYILVGVSEEYFPELMKTEGYEKDGFTYGAEKITREQAIEIGNKWTKQTEKITNQEEVIKILAKVALNTELSQKEKDAINPDKPEAGINKTPKFNEGLDKFLNQK